MSHNTFFKIELSSLNHPCNWVIGGHKKSSTLKTVKRHLGNYLRKMAVLHSKNRAKICKMAVSLQLRPGPGPLSIWVIFLVIGMVPRSFVDRGRVESVAVSEKNGFYRQSLFSRRVGAGKFVAGCCSNLENKHSNLCRIICFLII